MLAPPPSPLPSTRPADAFIERGAVHVMFAFDVGGSIDLEAASRALARVGAADAERRPPAAAPAYFQYRPLPLLVTRPSPAREVAGFRTEDRVRVVVFDFGAVSLSYRIPLRCPFASLLDLSVGLSDNAALAADARARVEELTRDMGDAVRRPLVRPAYEDYAVFHVESLRGAGPTNHWLDGAAADAARLLRAERAALSPQEIADALSCRISYSEDDATVVDWNAALIVGRDADAERAVLEHANVELLELRQLDEQLDNALEDAASSLASGLGAGRLLALFPRSGLLRRVGELQMDGALLFEAVNNALKLVGDQYLARLYRLAAKRFHLPEWDAGILRKLDTLDSVYQKVSDAQAARRMEVLEWIIILLIAASIAIPFIA